MLEFAVEFGKFQLKEGDDSRVVEMAAKEELEEREGEVVDGVNELRPKSEICRCLTGSRKSIIQVLEVGWQVVQCRMTNA